MSGPKPRPALAAIAPYVGGRAATPDGRPALKLSSNETPFGPSPAAAKAFAEASASLHLYPDGSSAKLRAALGKRHGIDPAQIVCGEGSGGLFHLLAQAYLGPGDKMLHSEHGFLLFDTFARAAGADVVVVPEKDLRTDVDAMLAHVDASTRAIFLANPGNPTGSYLTQREIERLHAGLPSHVLLVLDGAYAEYVQRNDYDPGIALVQRAQNVVMTRTFSKVYGLAAARLGWGYFPPPIAETLNKIRLPFNCSAAAQAAGIAALEDDAHFARSIAHNNEWLPKLTQAIGALGIKVAPSVTNYLLLRFPNSAGRTAQDADAFLLSCGLILRRLENYGLPDCLRLTVGTAEANERVIAALADFMGGKR